MEATLIWKKAVKKLEQEFPRNNFNVWIKPTVGLNLENNQLTIGVPHFFIKSMLEKRFYPKIKAVVNEVSQQNLTLNFIVSEKASLPKKTQPSGPLFAEDSNQDPRLGKETVISRPHQKHTPRSQYTFTTFIVGNSNNFAYAAAQAVVDSPGKTYNPLFIYGGTGVGKTHLLHAIGHELLKRYADKKILCMSCEEFTNEIIASLNQGSIHKIREKLRGADALLVDDVQFISGKDFSQEEFFNTFNQLYLANKQIVICSDRPPKEIPKLESRLISRFLGGVTVDIQPPDYEMRVAIIKVKAKEFGITLSDQIIDFLANRIQTNIRELEGVLFSIFTASRINQAEPDLEFVQQKLGKIDKKPKPVKPKDVLTTVAQYFDLKIKDLVGKSRKAEYVLPRHLTMFLLRRQLGCPLEEVGDLLGSRDHTTVMYGVDKIERLFQEDPTTQKHLQQIKERLAQSLST